MSVFTGPTRPSIGCLLLVTLEDADIRAILAADGARNADTEGRSQCQ